MKKIEFIFLPKPAGLYNTGSICYFNSLLQILATCTSLRYWKSKSRSKLEDEFENFIANSYKLNPMSSTILLNTLKEKSPFFGNGQESASEALTLLLNNINDTNLNNMFMHRFKYTIQCISCSHITEQQKDHSILFELFHTSELNVSNILNIKKVLNDYKCNKCNNIGAIRIDKLTMLSEIIICLFNVYYNKSIHLFPKYLEFPGFDNNILKYEVIGQIEHSGSLNGGHYWARALRDDGVYLFDDISYSKSKLEPTKNTYMVIYHLIE
jgi:ubiquitin C-terminal hydrolase